MTSNTGPALGRRATAVDPLLDVTTVTTRVETSQQIEDDRRRLTTAQAIGGLGSFEIDVGSGMILRSEQLRRMLGLGTDHGVRNEDLSMTNISLVHPADRDRVRAMLADALGGADPATCTYRILRPDGDIRWVCAHAAHCRQRGRDLISGTMVDVTEQHDEASAADARQPGRDWSSQVPNDSAFVAMLDAVLTHPDQCAVAVALIEIDVRSGFDTRDGKAAAERALRPIADRLGVALRPTDLVSRVARDEFLVLRPDAGSPDVAAALGADIAALLVEPVWTGDRLVRLAASIGVTTSTPSDTTGSVLRDAEDAMHQSKRDGPNRVTVVDHEARLRSDRRRCLALAFPAALHGSELHLEYQPIVHVGSGRPAGFESVVRWEHATLGTVTSDELNSIAEATGLALPLGDWVIDGVLRQLAEWRADPRMSNELWMAINVSAAQLADPQLAGTVTDAIARFGVPPASVHLEITESVLMEHADDATATVHDLRARGVNVSIDDFGTGRRSFGYLSRLSVDTLKIDRSLVGALGRAAHGLSIVRAVIVLADTLGLDVIADGIETEAQRGALDRLGCTYGQGGLWGGPLRPAAASGWTVEQARSRATVSSRTPRQVHDSVLRFDSLEIGLDAHEVWIEGRPIDLTAKQFGLLAFLASRAGEVFTRGQLLHEVWRSSPEWQHDATVTEHIHRLRTRIEADPSRPRLLRTIRGAGYCFGAPR